MDALQKRMNLDEGAWALFRPILTPVQVARGDFLLRAGEVCKQVFFLDTGLVRAFYPTDGEERNVAFYVEGSFLTDLKSLRSDKPGALVLQALEPSTLFRMEKAQLLGLYTQSHAIEAFGRRLLESLLEEQESQARAFRIYSAEERYRRLAEQQPALLQRLSLGHLASFLGVRRETLSRIRARK